VLEPFEHLDLRREALQRVAVLDEMGTDDLDDHERQQPLVPREQGLIALAAAEEANGETTRDELVALLEGPLLAR
jgi:hypothetical protein